MVNVLEPKGVTPKGEGSFGSRRSAISRDQLAEHNMAKSDQNINRGLFERTYHNLYDMRFRLPC